MTREEGMAEIACPTADEQFLKEETEYVLKKLDISEEEWTEILESPNKTVEDYKNDRKIKEPLKKLYFFFSKEKI